MSNWNALVEVVEPLGFDVSEQLNRDESEVQ